MVEPGQKCSGFLLFGKGEGNTDEKYAYIDREQKRFAEQHHVLVEQFLWKKHLERAEFYDVVIFGYLEAVQEFLEKSELSKYQFSSIA